MQKTLISPANLLIKTVRKEIYFRLDEIDAVNIPENFKAAILGKIRNTSWNFCRINPIEMNFSLLEYDSFEKAHPELLRSQKYILQPENIIIQPIRKYLRENPPILHRVELYFSRSNPLFHFHSKITFFEERTGILKSPNIGFKKNFQKTLKQLDPKQIIPELRYLLFENPLQSN